MYPLKNSQAVKKSADLKSLGEKSCEIKGDGQEMAAMMLMLINFNNALVDFTSFCIFKNQILYLFTGI